MPQDWKPAAPPDDAGVPVQGPVRLAQGPEITVQLDGLQAHDGGLALHLRWRATGACADAIRHLDAARRAVPLRHEPTGAAATAGPTVHVVVAGTTGEVTPCEGRASSTADGYVRTGQYWLAGAPSHGQMRLTVAWPSAGLPAVTTDLRWDSDRCA